MSPWLGQTWQGLISVQPNAGLPELSRRPDLLSAGARRAGAMARALRPRGRRQLRRRLLRHRRDAHRRRRRDAAPPGRRRLPAAAESPQPAARPGAGLAVLGRAAPPGERLSRRSASAATPTARRSSRSCRTSGDWDGCVAMGREQAREGSHALDVCTAYVGRDEVADMTEVIDPDARPGRRAAGASIRPSCRCSRPRSTSMAARAIINSINFEDGEAAPEARMRLARKFGAACIALTIDEAGMAKTARTSSASPAACVEFACGRFGLRSPTC